MCGGVLLVVASQRQTDRAGPKTLLTVPGLAPLLGLTIRAAGCSCKVDPLQATAPCQPATLHLSVSWPQQWELAVSGLSHLYTCELHYTTLPPTPVVPDVQGPTC